MNRSYNTLIMFFVAHFLFAINQANAADNAEQNPFELTVRVTEKPPYKLSFELRNTSEEPLAFFQEVLGRKEMSLLLVPDKPFGEPLMEAVQLYYPSQVEFLLDPGKTFVEEHNLSEKFTELADKLSNTDVLVFWKVSVATASNSLRQSFGGFIPIISSRAED